jgi:hypothetical protein
MLTVLLTGLLKVLNLQNVASLAAQAKKAATTA